FWFVLDQLCAAAREGRLIGREAILAAAREVMFPLSQKEVRNLLEEMERQGLAKIGRGRGGSRVTPLGMELWKNQGVAR
ncbi:MAG: AAA family ATPase, partial [Clostridium sp.]|nr:AAA family ATPase [Clostridium sp.]